MRPIDNLRSRRCVALKPHLKAHVVSDCEAVLVGENHRFALRGHAYAVLAPLLDGSRSAEEIVAAVNGKLSPEMAYFALERLKRRDLVTEVSETTQAPWSIWWSANGEDPSVRVAAAGRSRASIASLGIPGDVTDTFAALVGRSLQLSDANATLQLCLVDDYLRPELADHLEAALQQGRRFLPIRPVGTCIWMGPLCRPDDPPDWSALMARLRANRSAEVAALRKGATFPIVPAASTPETLASGLSLAALAAVQCASDCVPKAVDRSIWTFDTHAFEARTHALPATIGNPGRVEATCAQRIDLRPSRKRYTADGGHRVCSPAETLDRLSPLVSPVTGIIGSIEKLETASTVHVHAAVHDMAVAPARNRVLGRPHGATGKGATEIQSRVSCLAEAVERYSCGFFEDMPRRTARLRDIGPAAIHPNDITQFSPRQYQERTAWNARHGDGFNWIPEPFDPGIDVEWTPVWSLNRQQTRWVPTALCHFGYDAALTNGAPQFARACSNGCASGNTLEEAILQGLFELIERDACALWWYNRVRRPAIDLASFREPFFDEMRDYYGDRGRSLHVLDLRNDLGVPVAMAVSWQTAGGGEIVLGLGCHLEPRMAVSRALSELNQMMPYGDSGRAQDLPSLDDANMAAAAAWKRDATVDNQPYLAPLGDSLIRASDLEDRSSDDISVDIRHCVERLDQLGYETLVFEHTRPDIGFPTARVIVPGLRHFWARFAPGRLYDAPAALGWVDRPNCEDSLNPIPFFL